ncbi:WG repeat-containing protein [Roseibium aggregatum]|uniref:WG repeat-containing protein n=1 Tax=Roseibium aggregatum TaxID=187304 RepID=A0A939EHP8_9HYPH|nr:WG repeat-containing protein [Roseibium aggregatum]MBN9673397.1 WG repeat-containing protein [Roseibium aggregatum]
MSVSDGLLPPAFASALNLDTHGLGSAICGNHLYFVAPTGKFIRAFIYDNGPDYFSAGEGLARFVSRDGLIGYVDETLEIVIPARYEDAFPFRNGKAKVLTVRGGARLWSWIDETGAQVPPGGQ